MTLKLLGLTAALCAAVFMVSLQFVPVHVNLQDWAQCPVIGVCNLPAQPHVKHPPDCRLGPLDCGYSDNGFNGDH